MTLVQDPGFGKLTINAHLHRTQMTQKLAASTEFGQMTLVGKEETHMEGMFLLGYYRLRDLCESQLPENRERNERNKEPERVQH